MKNINLKLIRISLDKTQKEMSELMGIHENTYINKELGKSKLSINDIYALSKLTKKTFEELFPRKE